MRNISNSDRIHEKLSNLHTESLELITKIYSSPVELLEDIAVFSFKHSTAHFIIAGAYDRNGTLQQMLPLEKVNGSYKTLGKKQSVFQKLHDQLQESSCRLITDFSKFADDPELVEFLQAFSSMMNVPINKGKRKLGRLMLFTAADSDPFSDIDLDVINHLASYAAVAIANIRLYNHLSQREMVLTRRSKNLALLNELALTLSSATEINEMTEKVLDQVMDFLHLEVGEIYLHDEHNDTISLAHHVGDILPSLLEKQTFNKDEDFIQRIIQEGGPLLFNTLDENRVPQLSEVLRSSSMVHMACFPLNAGSKILGLLLIANDHPEPLDEMELQFMTIIASWVGTVIENARLNLQQRRLAVLEERERIGMDLHDGVIQSIYAVGLTLEHAKLLLPNKMDNIKDRIDQAIDDLNNAIRDLRSYILDLRPHNLRDENLLQGIQRLVNEFRINTLVEIQLIGSMKDFANLPNAQAIALFHICQETLANIAKHARANKVIVSLWASADRAIMEIQDNGRGFDMKKINFTLGHGLSNMHTRAKNVGGEVDVTSELNKGTTVLAWVPYPNVPKKEDITDSVDNPLASKGF